MAEGKSYSAKINIETVFKNPAGAGQIVGELAKIIGEINKLKVNANNSIFAAMGKGDIQKTVKTFVTNFTAYFDKEIRGKKAGEFTGLHDKLFNAGETAADRIVATFNDKLNKGISLDPLKQQLAQLEVATGQMATGDGKLKLGDIKQAADAINNTNKFIEGWNKVLESMPKVGTDITYAIQMAQALAEHSMAALESWRMLPTQMQLTMEEISNFDAKVLDPFRETIKQLLITNTQRAQRGRDPFGLSTLRTDMYKISNEMTSSIMKLKKTNDKLREANLRPELLTGATDYVRKMIEFVDFFSDPTNLEGKNTAQWDQAVKAMEKPLSTLQKYTSRIIGLMHSLDAEHLSFKSLETPKIIAAIQNLNNTMNTLISSGVSPELFKGYAAGVESLAHALKSLYESNEIIDTSAKFERMGHVLDTMIIYMRTITNAAEGMRGMYSAMNDIVSIFNNLNVELGKLPEDKLKALGTALSGIIINMPGGAAMPNFANMTEQINKMAQAGAGADNIKQYVDHTKAAGQDIPKYLNNIKNAYSKFGEDIFKQAFTQGKQVVDILEKNAQNIADKYAKGQSAVYGIQDQYGAVRGYEKVKSQMQSFMTDYINSIKNDMKLGKITMEEGIFEMYNSTKEMTRTFLSDRMSLIKSYSKEEQDLYRKIWKLPSFKNISTYGIEKNERGRATSDIKNTVAGLEQIRSAWEGIISILGDRKEEVTGSEFIKEYMKGFIREMTTIAINGRNNLRDQFMKMQADITLSMKITREKMGEELQRLHEIEETKPEGWEAMAAASRRKIAGLSDEFEGFARKSKASEEVFVSGMRSIGGQIDEIKKKMEELSGGKITKLGPLDLEFRFSESIIKQQIDLVTNSAEEQKKHIMEMGTIVPRLSDVAIKTNQLSNTYVNFIDVLGQALQSYLKMSDVLKSEAASSATTAKAALSDYNAEAKKLASDMEISFDKLNQIMKLSGGDVSEAGRMIDQEAVAQRQIEAVQQYSDTLKIEGELVDELKEKHKNNAVETISALKNTISARKKELELYLQNSNAIEVIKQKHIDFKRALGAELQTMIESGTATKREIATKREKINLEIKEIDIMRDKAIAEQEAVDAGKREQIKLASQQLESIDRLKNVINIRQIDAEQLNKTIDLYKKVGDARKVATGDPKEWGVYADKLKVGAESLLNSFSFMRAGELPADLFTNFDALLSAYDKGLIPTEQLFEQFQQLLNIRSILRSIISQAKANPDIFAEVLGDKGTLADVQRMYKHVNSQLVDLTKKQDGLNAYKKIEYRLQSEINGLYSKSGKQWGGFGEDLSEQEEARLQYLVRCQEELSELTGFEIKWTDELLAKRAEQRAKEKQYSTEIIEDKKFSAKVERERANIIDDIGAKVRGEKLSQEEILNILKEQEKVTDNISKANIPADGKVRQPAKSYKEATEPPDVYRRINAELDAVADQIEKNAKKRAKYSKKAIEYTKEELAVQKQIIDARVQLDRVYAGHKKQKGFEFDIGAIRTDVSKTIEALEQIKEKFSSVNILMKDKSVEDRVENIKIAIKSLREILLQTSISDFYNKEIEGPFREDKFAYLQHVREQIEKIRDTLREGDKDTHDLMYPIMSATQVSASKTVAESIKELYEKTLFQTSDAKNKLQKVLAEPLKLPKTDAGLKELFAGYDKIFSSVGGTLKDFDFINDLIFKIRTQLEQGKTVTKSVILDYFENLSSAWVNYTNNVREKIMANPIMGEELGKQAIKTQVDLSKVTQYIEENFFKLGSFGKGKPLVDFNEQMSSIHTLSDYYKELFGSMRIVEEATQETASATQDSSTKMKEASSQVKATELMLTQLAKALGVTGEFLRNIIMTQGLEGLEQYIAKQQEELNKISEVADVKAKAADADVKATKAKVDDVEAMKLFHSMMDKVISSQDAANKSTKENIDLNKQAADAAKENAKQQEAKSKAETASTAKKQIVIDPRYDSKKIKATYEGLDSTAKHIKEMSENSVRLSMKLAGVREMLSDISGEVNILNRSFGSGDTGGIIAKEAFANYMKQYEALLKLNVLLQDSAVPINKRYATMNKVIATTLDVTGRTKAKIEEEYAATMANIERDTAQANEMTKKALDNKARNIKAMHELQIGIIEKSEHQAHIIKEETTALKEQASAYSRAVEARRAPLYKLEKAIKSLKELDESYTENVINNAKAISAAEQKSYSTKRANILSEMDALRTKLGYKKQELDATKLAEKALGGATKAKADDVKVIADYITKIRELETQLNAVFAKFRQDASTKKPMLEATGKGHEWKAYVKASNEKRDALYKELNAMYSLTNVEDKYRDSILKSIQLKMAEDQVVCDINKSIRSSAATTEKASTKTKEHADNVKINTDALKEEQKTKQKSATIDSDALKNAEMLASVMAKVADINKDKIVDSTQTQLIKELVEAIKSLGSISSGVKIDTTIIDSIKGVITSLSSGAGKASEGIGSLKALLDLMKELIVLMQLFEKEGSKQTKSTGINENIKTMSNAMVDALGKMKASMATMLDEVVKFNTSLEKDFKKAGGVKGAQEQITLFTSVLHTFIGALSFTGETVDKFINNINKFASIKDIFVSTMTTMGQAVNALMVNMSGLTKEGTLLFTPSQITSNLKNVEAAFKVFSELMTKTDKDIKKGQDKIKTTMSQVGGIKDAVKDMAPDASTLSDAKENIDNFYSIIEKFGNRMNILFGKEIKPGEYLAKVLNSVGNAAKGVYSVFGKMAGEAIAGDKLTNIFIQIADGIDAFIQKTKTKHFGDVPKLFTAIGKTFTSFSHGVATSTENVKMFAEGLDILAPRIKELEGNAAVLEGAAQYIEAISKMFYLQRSVSDKTAGLNSEELAKYASEAEKVSSTYSGMFATIVDAFSKVDTTKLKEITTLLKTMKSLISIVAKDLEKSFEVITNQSGMLTSILTTMYNEIMNFADNIMSAGAGGGRKGKINVDEWKTKIQTISSVAEMLKQVAGIMGQLSKVNANIETNATAAGQAIVKLGTELENFPKGMQTLGIVEEIGMIASSLEKVVSLSSTFGASMGTAFEAFKPSKTIEGVSVLTEFLINVRESVASFSSELDAGEAKNASWLSSLGKLIPALTNMKINVTEATSTIDQITTALYTFAQQYLSADLWAPLASFTNSVTNIIETLSKLSKDKSLDVFSKKTVRESSKAQTALSAIHIFVHKIAASMGKVFTGKDAGIGLKRMGDFLMGFGTGIESLVKNLEPAFDILNEENNMLDVVLTRIRESLLKLGGDEVKIASAALGNLGKYINAVVRSGKTFEAQAPKITSSFANIRGLIPSEGIATPKAISSIASYINSLKGLGDAVEKIASLSQENISKFNSNLTLLVPLAKEIRSNFDLIAPTTAKATHNIMRTTDKAKDHFMTLKKFFRYIFMGSGIYFMVRRIRQFMQDLIREVQAVEASFVNFQAISGATERQMDSLRKGIGVVSSSFGYMMSEIGKSSVALAKAGIKAQDATNSLYAIAALARAAMEEMEIATKIAIIVMKAYQMEGTQMMEVTNHLTAMLLNSKLTLEDMQTQLSYVSSTAAAAGISFQDLGVALAVMSNSGLKASQVGTSLRGIIGVLLSPNNRLLSVLKSIGVTADEVNPATNKLIDIFERLNDAGFDVQKVYSAMDRRIAQGTVSLVSNVHALKEMEFALSNSAPAIQIAMAQMSSFENATKRLTATLQSGLTPSFNYFLGIASSIMNSLAVLEHRMGLLTKAVKLAGYTVLFMLAKALGLTSIEAIKHGKGIGKLGVAYNKLMYETVILANKEQELALTQRFLGNGTRVLNEEMHKSIQAHISSGKSLALLNTQQKEYFIRTMKSSYRTTNMAGDALKYFGATSVSVGKKILTLGKAIALSLGKFFLIMAVVQIGIKLFQVFTEKVDEHFNSFGKLEGAYKNAREMTDAYNSNMKDATVALTDATKTADEYIAKLDGMAASLKSVIYYEKLRAEIEGMKDVDVTTEEGKQLVKDVAEAQYVNQITGINIISNEELSKLSQAKKDLQEMNEKLIAYNLETKKHKVLGLVPGFDTVIEDARKVKLEAHKDEVESYTEQKEYLEEYVYILENAKKIEQAKLEMTDQQTRELEKQKAILDATPKRQQEIIENTKRMLLMDMQRYLDVDKQDGGKEDAVAYNRNISEEKYLTLLREEEKLRLKDIEQMTSQEKFLYTQEQTELKINAMQKRRQAIIQAINEVKKRDVSTGEDIATKEQDLALLEKDYHRINKDIKETETMARKGFLKNAYELMGPMFDAARGIKEYGDASVAVNESVFSSFEQGIKSVTGFSLLHKNTIKDMQTQILTDETKLIGTMKIVNEQIQDRAEKQIVLNGLMKDYIKNAIGNNLKKVLEESGVMTQNYDSMMQTILQGWDKVDLNNITTASILFTKQTREIASGFATANNELYKTVMLLGGAIDLQEKLKEQGTVGLAMGQQNIAQEGYESSTTDLNRGVKGALDILESYSATEQLMGYIMDQGLTFWSAQSNWADSVREVNNEYYDMLLHMDDFGAKQDEVSNNFKSMGKVLTNAFSDAGYRVDAILNDISGIGDLLEEKARIQSEIAKADKEMKYFMEHPELKGATESISAYNNELTRLNDTLDLVNMQENFLYKKRQDLLNIGPKFDKGQATADITSKLSSLTASEATYENIMSILKKSNQEVFNILTTSSELEQHFEAALRPLAESVVQAHKLYEYTKLRYKYELLNDERMKSQVERQLKLRAMKAGVKAEERGVDVAKTEYEAKDEDIGEKPETKYIDEYKQYNDELQAAQYNTKSLGELEDVLANIRANNLASTEEGQKTINALLEQGSRFSDTESNKEDWVRFEASLTKEKERGLSALASQNEYEIQIYNRKQQEREAAKKELEDKERKLEEMQKEVEKAEQVNGMLDKRDGILSNIEQAELKIMEFESAGTYEDKVKSGEALMKFVTETGDQLVELNDAWQMSDESVKQQVGDVQEINDTYNEYIKNKLLESGIQDELNASSLTQFQVLADICGTLIDIKNALVPQAELEKDAVDANKKSKEAMDEIVSVTNKLGPNLNDINSTSEAWRINIEGVDKRLKSIARTLRAIGVIDTLDLDTDVEDTGTEGHATGGYIRKFPRGGLVRGAGKFINDISDKIPAFLSNREYVINSFSTRLFKPLLDMINYKPMTAKKKLGSMAEFTGQIINNINTGPKYATGGVVQAPQQVNNNLRPLVLVVDNKPYQMYTDNEIANKVVRAFQKRSKTRK